MQGPTLSALADQAGSLVEGLEALGCEVAFQHVRRELNAEADALANAAMDAAASSLTHTADFAPVRNKLPLPKRDAQDAAESGVEGAEPEDDDGDRPAALPPCRIPRLTALPSGEELLGWLSVVHQDSRVLGRLPPVRQWRAETLWLGPAH